MPYVWHCKLWLPISLRISFPCKRVLEFRQLDAIIIHWQQARISLMRGKGIHSKMASFFFSFLAIWPIHENQHAIFFLQQFLCFGRLWRCDKYRRWASGWYFWAFEANKRLSFKRSQTWKNLTHVSSSLK